MPCGPRCQNARGRRCRCSCDGAGHGGGADLVPRQLVFGEFAEDPRQPSFLDALFTGAAALSRQALQFCGSPMGVSTMSLLFKPAEVTTAYLKMGLLGFQGSGKTKTATKTAIGLVDHLKRKGAVAADRPVFFFDTETGSDWVLPDFKAAGIAVEQAKSRAFSDLCDSIKAAEQQASVLLINSITHPWKELCESYCRRKAQMLKRNYYRLQIGDWAYLKGENGWGKFADLFINSGVHIILCGRAGYEFDMDTDEEGHKQLEKTGVKMKAEGEFGYEPSLLVYMEMHQEMKGRGVERQWRTATVLKDRAGLIDGKSFDDPGFQDFLPHIERLNIGGRQLGVDVTRTSAAMIPADPRDNSATHRKIVLDEIEQLMAIHCGGQSAADKKRRAELIRAKFKAAPEEMATLMPLAELRHGYDQLLWELEHIYSRYHADILAGERGALDTVKKTAGSRFDHADHGGVPAFLARKNVPQPVLFAGG